MRARYDYIHRAYGASFFALDRVEHTVSGQSGEVMPPTGPKHYVRVRFDSGHPGLCHPDELKITGRGRNWRSDPAPPQTGEA